MKPEQHNNAQQQQSQQSLQSAQLQQLAKDVNDNNNEDSRFEVPTEQPVQQTGVGGGVAVAIGAKNDITYQEVNFNNSSTNEGFTIQNEEKELETRLK